MRDYVIYTDSACDILPERMKELGIAYSSLTTYFENEDRSYTIDDMSAEGFYAKMREGHYAKTAAVNVEAFVQGFEPILAAGKDILYIGLSGGVSSTYHASCMAAEELAQKYPEAKILTVDSRTGSIGQAMLIEMVLERKNDGASVEEAAAFAEEMKSEICLWATFDDLTALRKSGRVSFSTALIGNFLNIKPIIYVSEEGKIINEAKARGRKKAFALLLEKFGKLAKNVKSKVFLAHTDCAEDVEAFGKELTERYGATVERVMNVGPVIGAHSGLGALVLSFIGRKVNA